MIEICEECGQKFRLNQAVREMGMARFRCKTCGHVITISAGKIKTVEETLEEALAQDFPGAAKDSAFTVPAPSPAAVGSEMPPSQAKQGKARGPETG